MARFKQFGDVVINLDQVVKVEKTDEVVRVYLAGASGRLRVEAPGGSAGMAWLNSMRGDDEPGTHVFRDREATEAWAFFTSTLE